MLQLWLKESTRNVLVGSICKEYCQIYCPPEMFLDKDACSLEKVGIYCWGMMIYHGILLSNMKHKIIKKRLKEEIKCKKSNEEYEKFMEKLGNLPSDDNYKDIKNIEHVVSILKNVLDFDPDNRPSFK